MATAKSPTLEAIAAQITALAEASAEYFAKMSTSSDFVGLLVAYHSLKTKYDELDTARKLIYELVDNVNKQVIPKRFEALGTDKVQVPEIKKSFYPLTKYSASVLDKEEGYKWLRANDLGAIITETVNAGTLSNTLNEYVVEHGKDPPDTLFKLSTYQTTGMSNYNPKTKK